MKVYYLINVRYGASCFIYIISHPVSNPMSVIILIFFPVRKLRPREFKSPKV